jgi:BlaI family penicillinase repressor
MNKKTLSPLEQEIMVVVWNLKKCHAREVLNKLKKPLAYTTIATILQRLYKKGMVGKTSEGNIFVYSPKSTSEEYSKKIAKSFLLNFFESFGDSAIVSFAESVESLPKNKKAEFLNLLNSHNEA